MANPVEVDPAFRPIADAFKNDRAVTAGRMMQSFGLKVNGKIAGEGQDPDHLTGAAASREEQTLTVVTGSADVDAHRDNAVAGRQRFQRSTFERHRHPVGAGPVPPTSSHSSADRERVARPQRSE